MGDVFDAGFLGIILVDDIQTLHDYGPERMLSFVSSYSLRLFHLVHYGRGRFSCCRACHMT